MTFVKPMLAKPISRLNLLTAYQNVGWIPQLKIDGWRAIITRDGNEVHVYSRTGREYTKHVPHIVEEVIHTLPDNSTWDGEIVFIPNLPTFVIGSTVIPPMSFNQTARMMGSGYDKSLAKQKAADGYLAFIVFDCLRVYGQDITDLAYHIRYDPRTIPYSPYILRVPEWDSESLFALYSTVTNQGLEGLVLKDMSAAYAPGKRSNANVKVKVVNNYDVVVCGSTQGKGKYEGMVGALKFGAFDSEGNLIEIGQTSGMSDHERIDWTLDMPLPGTAVIEIKSNGLTDADNSLGLSIPRHPQYVSRRNDKSPADCTIDQFRKYR